MAGAEYTHLSPSMFATFEKAVERYTQERDALPESDTPYWLHKAFIQVFPTFAKKQMEERIHHLEKQITEGYGHHVAQKIIWSLARTLRTYRAAGKSRLGLKDSARLVAASRRILQDFTDKSLDVPELKTHISSIVTTYAEGPAAPCSCDELLTELSEPLQKAVSAWCRRKKGFMQTLPLPRPDRGIDTSWFSWLCERAYLLRRVSLPERPLQAAYLLEPFLIEILQAQGKTPEDYHRCPDIRVQVDWHQEAQRRMREVTEGRYQAVAAASSEDFPLPVFLRCTATQWARLMELIGSRYSITDKRYVWPPERRWWEARFLLDSLCSTEGIKLIDRNQPGASNYGSLFLSLFTCSSGGRQDEAAISGRLTKSENQPTRKNTYRNQQTKQEIEQAILRIFR